MDEQHNYVITRNGAVVGAAFRVTPERAVRRYRAIARRHAEPCRLLQIYNGGQEDVTPPPVMSEARIIARLRAGERLRVGYTFTYKAHFDNGDIVDSRIMRRLRKRGLISQDANGFIQLV